MPLTLMERLLTQTGRWISITPPDDPKDAEVRTEHMLSRIRVSISQRGASDSGTGERRITASATLFFKAGYSTVDGAASVPSFLPGDIIISPMEEEWTVRGAVRCYAPEGPLHHLEVQLA